MSRLTQVLLATSNPGKVRELRARLASLHIDVLGLADVPLPPGGEVEETGTTYAANATLKAVGYGRAANLPTLADDSGLDVDALDGAPGVYSARFAGPGATDALNNALLLERLAGVTHRAARFRCVVALYLPPHLQLPDLPATLTTAGLTLAPPFDGALPGERLILSAGSTEGTILHDPHGDGGFGYDPLFLSHELHTSFAEASIEAKGAISHRGRALEPVERWLRSLG